MEEVKQRNTGKKLTFHKSLRAEILDNVAPYTQEVHFTETGEIFTYKNDGSLQQLVGHIHGNREVIDKFSVGVDGKLLFDGKEIDGTFNDIVVKDVTVEGSIMTITYGDDTTKEIEIQSDGVSTWDLLQNKPFDNVDGVKLVVVDGKLTIANDFVAGSHTHENKDVIDKFDTDENGKLLFDGNEIIGGNDVSCLQFSSREW